MNADDFTIATHAASATSTSFSPLPTTLYQIATIATTLISKLPHSGTTTISSSPTPSSRPGDDEGTGECQLLGPFAILVQGALGVLALSSLVYKRWRERPQRPLKIWAFDASKQVFGSVLLHLANLLMSMFSSGQIKWIAQASINTAEAASKSVKTTATEYQPNPCSFYLLNLAIDTTLGIPILILILKVLTVAASYIARPADSIKSGHYGDPPRATWWLKQSIIYFIGLILMKICVFFVFQLCPWIVRVGDWALRWTEGNEAIQIAFVMLIFPLIMNALQYYIIDTFIKGKNENEEDDERREGNEGEHGGLLANEHDGHGQSIDEDDAYKAKIKKINASGQVKEIEREERDDEEESGESSSLGSGPEREGTKNPPRI